MLKIDDIKTTAMRRGFYVLSSPSNSSLGGYVDFNEGSMRYNYTTADGLRVISTIPEVFFLKSHNSISYLDTTQSTTMDNVMYQFTLTPNNSSAVVKVMAIVHAKDNKFFNSITANSVPLTVTRDGYSFAGQNISTSAVYRSWTDSLGSNLKTTDKYPFKQFNATVDLEHDALIIDFMMGDSAVVSATGSTYPDYTGF